VSESDVTTIYGAAKLSGKTESGWSIGLLEAITAPERANLIDPDGATRERVIEPLANYAVLQVQREANRGRTRVGGAVTSVTRRIDDVGIEFLHDQAVTGGLRLDHRFARDRWLVEARALGSWVHGEPTAIDRTQRASQRYYQRPDADHLDYDPTRTSLAGAGLLWTIKQDADKRLRYGLQGDLRSPGLELNDLGFQFYADRISHQGWVELRDDTPGDALLRYDTRLLVWGVADWEPRLHFIGAMLSANATFTNYWVANAGFGTSQNRWDPGLLRGGPLMRRNPSWWGWLGVNTDYRRKVHAYVNSDYSFDDTAGSWTVGVNPGVTVRPRTNLDMSLEMHLGRNQLDDQFVAEALDTGGAPAYVMARIDQTSLGLSVRANYTLSPTLSLQLYAQPFVSVGAYDSYREVTDPRADAYDDRFSALGDALIANDGGFSVDRDGDGAADYGFGRPDFNFRQLRTNLIARWEYSPGSTLFAVWAYRGGRGDNTGVFSLGDELSQLTGAPAEHVLLLKLSCWFGL
jgi:hypothetical protein